jgi:hypothetical protein
MTFSVEVHAALTIDVHHAGDLAVCLAATGPIATESLTARASDDADVPLREVRQHLSRTHVLSATVGESRLTYRTAIETEGSRRRR